MCGKMRSRKKSSATTPVGKVHNYCCYYYYCTTNATTSTTVLLVDYYLLASLNPAKVYVKQIEHFHAESLSP